VAGFSKQRPVPRDRTKLRKPNYKFTLNPSHVLYILLPAGHFVHRGVIVSSYLYFFQVLRVQESMSGYTRLSAYTSPCILSSVILSCLIKTFSLLRRPYKISSQLLLIEMIKVSAKKLKV
jgi:hypothetical protein